jgi:hypothetical protein
MAGIQTISILSSCGHNPHFIANALILGSSGRACNESGANWRQKMLVEIESPVKTLAGRD